MKTRALETAKLGDLIVAAFDEAARYTADPKLVAQLATRAVISMLRHAPRASTARGRLAGPC